jgi:hypothetical protein
MALTALVLLLIALAASVTIRVVLREVRRG